MVSVPPLASNSPASVRRAIKSSLRVKGVRLFNSVPKEIREMKDVTVDSFKTALDAWLTRFPDQPNPASTNFLSDQFS